MFKLGMTVITNGINDKMIADPDFRTFLMDSLEKFMDQDWGDTCEEDKRSNDYAVKHDERILAVYIYPKTEEKIWIIIEWDRSTTTILFPSEY